MNQTIYLSKLKLALRGMPAIDVGDILGDCERHFFDGRAAGRSEEDIASSLGDPRQMAAEMRVAVKAEAYVRKSSLGNLLRLVPAFSKVISFNLMTMFPATILLLLLLSIYMTSGTAVVAGTLMTVSAATGIDHVGVRANGNIVFQSWEERAATQSVTETFSLDVGTAGARLSWPEKALPSTGSDRFNINLAAAVSNSEPKSAAGWSLLFGIGYILAGLVLWHVSGRMGRAMLRGLVKYMRLNISMLKGDAH